MNIAESELFNPIEIWNVNVTDESTKVTGTTRPEKEQMDIPFEIHFPKDKHLKREDHAESVENRPDSFKEKQAESVLNSSVHPGVASASDNASSWNYPEDFKER